MVELASVLGHLRAFKVLVAGDFMIDLYTTGTVQRISPEAPVPILHVENERLLPGGAGNVALNLAALGAEVFVLGRIGCDRYGKQLKQLLNKQNIDTSGLIVEKTYQTPVKNRLIAGNQQMLRIDQETVEPLSDIAPALEHLTKVDLIAISDYNKGFLTYPMIQALMARAKDLNIPVLVDPKGEDFSKYYGATLIKPNLKEAIAAAKLPKSAPLLDVAKVLFNQSDAEQILITRSADGLSLFTQDGNSQDFPVNVHEVQDVTGAGDTVLAVLSMCLANGLDTPTAARLANIAASLAVEKLGCVRIGIFELAERLLTLDNSSKIFNENHLYALESVLKKTPCTILAIDAAEGMSTELFQAIQSLSEFKLILYIRDACPNATFIELLASLKEVNFIVIQSDSLTALADRIHPQECYLFENGKLITISAISALLS